MLTLDITSKSFKKDIQRVKSQGKKFDLLHEVLDILLAEKKRLSAKYHPHKLAGNYQGYWELHIQPDWLLIYKIVDTRVCLIRTDSHAELFK